VKRRAVRLSGRPALPRPRVGPRARARVATKVAGVAPISTRSVRTARRRVPAPAAWSPTSTWTRCGHSRRTPASSF